MVKTTKKPSMILRLLKGGVSAIVTLAFAGGAFYTVATGADLLDQRAEASTNETTAPPTPVRTRLIMFAESYTVERRFVGQIEAPEKVDLSFELGGRLRDIQADEGDRVAKGDVLARLDTDLLMADRDRLMATRSGTQAQLDFATQQVERNEALSERGFASQERLDQALANQLELRAQIDRIDAELATIALRLQKSVLKAPTDGRITVARVDGGETLAAGQVILGLVAEGAPQVRVGLPLDLDPHALGTVKVLIDGEAHAASLETVRPDVDPVTRTRTAIFKLDAPATLAIGQTARMQLELETSARGAWLPVRSLKEGARGTWTLQVVDDSNVVRAAAVEIIHAESDQVYVRGTFPEGTRLISEGPQRVTVGQLVEDLGEER